MRILVINPGSTSTKIAIYNDLNQDLTQNLRHSIDLLSKFNYISEQYEFRKQVILDFLKNSEISLDSLDAVVGRGGLVKPIPGGVYKVCDNMIRDLHRGVLGEHASNLGGIIASAIVKEANHEIPAFIVDPVVVDEMDNIARFSGYPQLPRTSIFHALNQKAVARRYAHDIDSKYEDLRLIVVHLGGGITVGVHRKGHVVDVNNGLDGDGPFSPERSGTLPVGPLVKLAFSGQFQLFQFKKMITGNGGLVAYLGTNNATEVEKRIEEGDYYARQVYEAMAYQIAKEIGGAATVLSGRVDAILITGGLAYSEMLVNWVQDRVGFIAPIKIYPGEDEMQALAEGCYYALTGELKVQTYE
ncbi:MAG: butyrate kinase [Candidatus Kapabacteria bacterium]|nr:butyrate kinase [Candidatus Kapabacteria bacterium]